VQLHGNHCETQATPLRRSYELQIRLHSPCRCRLQSLHEGGELAEIESTRLACVALDAVPECVELIVVFRPRHTESDEEEAEFSARYESGALSLNDVATAVEQVEECAQLICAAAQSHPIARHFNDAIHVVHTQRAEEIDALGAGIDEIACQGDLLGGLTPIAG
jgi:hypothetical protein